MYVFNCTKAATKYFTMTQNGKTCSLISKPLSKKIADNTVAAKRLGLPPQWQWQVQARRILGVECIIFMDINTRFAILLPFVDDLEFERLFTVFQHELCDTMFVYTDEHLSFHEEDLEKRMVQFQDQHSGFSCVHRHDQSAIAHIANFVEDFMVLVEAVGRFPDLDEIFGVNLLLNHFPRSIGKGKKSIIPLDEFYDGWLKHVLSATDKQRDELREVIRHNKLQQQEVINDEHASSHVLGKLLSSESTATKKTTASNVISLDAFRSIKTH